MSHETQLLAEHTVASMKGLKSLFNLTNFRKIHWKYWNYEQLTEWVLEMKDYDGFYSLRIYGCIILVHLNCVCVFFFCCKLNIKNIKKNDRPFARVFKRK